MVEDFDADDGMPNKAMKLANELNEALGRGHRVSALVTRPERLAAHTGLTALAADVMDVARLTLPAR